MTGWFLLAALLLLIANAFFVAVEFALLASRVTRLEPMAEDDDRRAARGSSNVKPSHGCACAPWGCAAYVGPVPELARVRFNEPSTSHSTSKRSKSKLTWGQTSRAGVGDARGLEIRG